MKYLVFDLDHTMADLHSYFFPLLALQHSLPGMDHAYAVFVRRILRDETSPYPIGLLRPGLLAVMEELAARCRAKEIHPLILYSNNSYLPCLHLVRDVINAYVGMNLVQHTIHWNHPIRRQDKLGECTKSWTVMQHFLPREVSPAEVVFFDDQWHPQVAAVLGRNYRQVAPYQFMSCFERVANHLLESLIEAGVDEEVVASELQGELPIPSDSMVELMGNYERVLGATEEKEVYPAGECRVFWEALDHAEYHPDHFL